MLRRIVTKLKEIGLWLVIIRGLKKINNKIFLILNFFEKKYIWKNAEEYKELRNLCQSKKYKSVFIFYPFLIWNLPAFQRPQQVATALSKNKDVLYIYCSPDPVKDDIHGLYKKLNDNLILTSDYEFVSGLKINNKIVQFYSTDVCFSYKQVEKVIKRNGKVLYEYIDGIDEKLLGTISKEYLERHDKIMRNEDIYVVASADKLIKDVKKYRSKNYSLICNGVTLKDFDVKKSKVPYEYKELKKKYKKIVCYYGALAIWFDYKLLIKCAKKYPEYAFVLIGVDYDKTLEKSGISKYENIIYLGKVEYKKLINYASNSDLLTIPFLINHITESTSPVKLFEYMASQKPILTTALPECKKYESVIIGESQEDYVKKIDSTIALVKDKEYLSTAMKEAKENTWGKKVMQMLDLVNGMEKN